MTARDLFLLADAIREAEYDRDTAVKALQAREQCVVLARVRLVEAQRVMEKEQANG